MDLARPRNVGELLTLALTLFASNIAVFLLMTFVVVAPMTVLVDGVWGGLIANNEYSTDAVFIVGALLIEFVFVSALVTGLHCVVVEGLARGETFGLRRAFSTAAPRVFAAIGTVALYSLMTALGLLLLVAPGVWIAVKCYFGAQAAVLEGADPIAGLRRSGELTEGSWWRVSGLLLLSLTLTYLVFYSNAEEAAAAGSGLFTLVVLVVMKTFAVSIGAIFATLVFFDLRARAEAPAPAGPPAGWLPPEPPAAVEGTTPLR